MLSFTFHACKITPGPSRYHIRYKLGSAVFFLVFVIVVVITIAAVAIAVGGVGGGGGGNGGGGAATAFVVVCNKHNTV